MMRIEDKEQWITLPNWAMQKSRAFQIKVVAEPTLDVHAQFTPPMLVLKQFCYLKHTHIYYSILLFKFCTYYIIF